jgi:hypothetical protein
MPTITVTAAVQGALGPLTATTELRDSDGRVIGYFTPAAEKDRALIEWAKKNVDLGELERREQSKEPGYTFEQVMAHLNSLESR